MTSAPLHVQPVAYEHISSHDAAYVERLLNFILPKGLENPEGSSKTQTDFARRFDGALNRTVRRFTHLNSAQCCATARTPMHRCKHHLSLTGAAAAPAAAAAAAVFCVSSLLSRLDSNGYHTMTPRGKHHFALEVGLEEFLHLKQRCATDPVRAV